MVVMIVPTLMAILSASGAASGQVAVAQAQAGAKEEGGRVAYPAAFYAAFQPQTVIDMLKRTPGFTLESDDDTRGFGANAGNVLIDGQRPSVKTGGLAPTLGRIAASRVERIELIRSGGTADTMGRAVVANVVLLPTTSGSGNGSIELRRGFSDDAITPRVELSYALPVAGWQTSASALAWYENNPLRGVYRREEPVGGQVQIADERLAIHTRGATFTLGTIGDVGGGTLSLNARIGHEREAYGQTLHERGATGTDGGIDGLYGEWNGELGGDWSRTLGNGWSTKLVALGRAETSHFSEKSRSDPTDRFASDARTSELVARVTVQRKGEYRLLPELGAEMAWNDLDNQFRPGVGGEQRRTFVAEVRSEVFANAVLTLNAAMRVETGLAFERSRIGVRSGGIPDRRLQYWKPNLSMIWDAGKRTQLRFGVRRSVGQLDFEGFAASGDLINDRPIAGNAELRPERMTVWSGTIDHRFGNGGAVSLTASRETIDDALAYVPLAQGGQALANFGTVRLWRIKGKATVPMDGLVSGGRISMDADIARTRRADPLTGMMRADARERDNIVNIAWRQDVSRIRSAWGLSAKIELPQRQWFVDQYQREWERPEISLYAETMLPRGIKATLTGSGLSGYVERRHRAFYQPDRNGKLGAVEHRVRRYGAYVTLLLARQF
ncbi:TonB-dependent receptor [Sphingomonas sp.]|uniref:TonB-dependent receptor plug domain-containing protein n=1 Tax=Sphingomonas sp. TaxID=28214 RepID=UPI0031CEA8E8